MIGDSADGILDMRLDADPKAAFDHIDHDLILAKIGSFPGREMIRGWLKVAIQLGLASPIRASSRLEVILCR